MGRDAITIGAEIVLALQTIVSRKLALGAGVMRAKAARLLRQIAQGIGLGWHCR
ncbi:hypothetical protein [uncultured Sulfitobacter sp.]|uniref:hypothetical protein n=1 Tax=uncultured Sulfitobacter sp. TaxID=191468 RepID=UPI00262AD16C|nr:hypothetical protein [uncultured Sulfitobacter sp.]